MIYIVEREFTPGGPDPRKKLLKLALDAARKEMGAFDRDHNTLYHDGNCALDMVDAGKNILIFEKKELDN